MIRLKKVLRKEDHPTFYPVLRVEFEIYLKLITEDGDWYQSDELHRQLGEDLLNKIIAVGKQNGLINI